MTVRILDVDLHNLGAAPKDCLAAVFWELDDAADDVDPFFQKEEWFSSTLLEWGTCGKLLQDGDDVVGFAQYAPPTLFPRVERFRAAPVSPDAVYLAYCYMAEPARRRGHGRALVRACARDLLDRGHRAVEAFGDRRAEGGAVLPEQFLTRAGMRVLRDDERFPLLRLELSGSSPDQDGAAASVELPELDSV